jgi:hypothetical protein
MEYADAIDPETIAAAVRLTRELGSVRTAPVSELAAEAVSKTFCTCVVNGEDAAERRFSAIHTRLIEQVATLAGSDAEPTEPIP